MDIQNLINFNKIEKIKYSIININIYIYTIIWKYRHLIN